MSTLGVLALKHQSAGLLAGLLNTSNPVSLELRLALKAAAGLRPAIQLRPASATHLTRERLPAVARAQLGEATFNAAWADGGKMTLEQAVVYALESATDE